MGLDHNSGHLGQQDEDEVQCVRMCGECMLLWAWGFVGQFVSFLFLPIPTFIHSSLWWKTRGKPVEALLPDSWVEALLPQLAIGVHHRLSCNDGGLDSAELFFYHRENRKKSYKNLKT